MLTRAVYSLLSNPPVVLLRVMEGSIPKNLHLDKVKANFVLGFTSNFMTLAGIVAAWIFLVRLELVDSFWQMLLTTFALIPALMGDSMDAYVLGWISLETKNNWNDVRITPEGRAFLMKGNALWRALSIATTVCLCAIFLTSLLPDAQAWKWLTWAFTVLLSLQVLRCHITIFLHFAPVVPIFRGRFLRYRVAATVISSILWLLWLHSREAVPFSKWSMIGHGTLFFLLSAVLHPLPSKFSIFRIPLEPAIPVPEKIEWVTDEKLIPGFSDPRMIKERELWTSQSNFLPLGFLRMPLLELPVFGAGGQIFLSPERNALFLLLKSDIHQRHHRTLVSCLGNKVLITTDFGAPDLRLPEGFDYVNQPPATTAADFLSAHQRRFSTPPETLDTDPEARINALTDRVREFLQEGQRTGDFKRPAQTQTA